MRVLHIVADITATDPRAAKHFSGHSRLDVMMDRQRALNIRRGLKRRA
jgi:hypothetical protein